MRYNLATLNIQRRTEMGALLQRVGLQRTPSPALIQAPSADLIRPDNELIMPELEVISCSMSADEINEYIKLAKSTDYRHQCVSGLYLLHKLSQNGFCRYNFKKTVDFMNQQVKHLGRVYQQEITWSWEHISNHGYLPPKILRTIAKTKDIFKDLDKDSLDFLINTTNINFSLKNGEGIFFLCIDTVKPAENWSEFAYVIDAWRGPTFSDEEARLP